MIAKNNPKTMRCAIYCRKSVANGLEKEFNSIDAQREACEAYIASKKHEGFLCLPDRYDDGGHTGANTDRPALKRLQADIEKGKVNCVVVHRIDRLSRSLSDFCRLAEIFEKHGTAFISTTQSLDTSSPMGRFTLNILFSFAEFEREMICARTKDKVAAARRRGRWTGGLPILGYHIAPGGRKLVVNMKEAKRVQGIFNLYLERQGLIETVKELSCRGWKRKEWITKADKRVGGSAFDKNSLYRLLTNPFYLGKMTYKDEIFEGEHPAIVDKETFQRVQRLLKRNGNGGKPRNCSWAILKGLLHCAPCQCAMSPTHTKKRNKQYHYYVCLGAQKRGWKTCPSKSVPAGEIEKFIIDQIRCIGRDAGLREEVLQQIKVQEKELRRSLEAKKRRQERALKRHSAALGKLMGQDGISAQVEALLGKVRAVEARLEEVKTEIARFRRNTMDKKIAARVLAEFERLWETLTQREQGGILRLLIKRVDYDGGKGTVSVEFHQSGIQALSDQIAKEEAA